MECAPGHYGIITNYSGDLRKGRLEPMHGVYTWSLWDNNQLQQRPEEGKGGANAWSVHLVTMG